MLYQKKGANFEVGIHGVKAKSSPLMQEGLEIPIKVLVIMYDNEKFAILNIKIEELNTLLGKTDDSKAILTEI